MTIGGKESKLELWSIEVKGHFGAEDYLFARAADNKGEHFFLIWLELYLQLFGGSQCLILEHQVVQLENDLFDIGVFVHFVCTPFQLD